MIICVGFGWTGSSAVADWLQHNRAIEKTPGGEVNQIRLSCHFFQELVERKRYFGYKIALHTLLPDPDLRHEVLSNLGDPRKRLTYAQSMADFLYRKVKNIGSDIKIREKLESNLGGDVALHKNYIDGVESLLCAFMSGDVEKVNLSSVGLMNVFKRSNVITLFDNGINGRNLSYLQYVLQHSPKKSLALVVVRDPRDQFADMCLRGVKSKADLFFFIRRSLVDYSNIRNLMSSDLGNLYITTFERFLNYDKVEMEKLKQVVNEFVEGYGLASQWIESGPFHPEESRRNIDVHRQIPDWINRIIKKYLLQDYRALVRDINLISR